MGIGELLLAIVTFLLFYVIPLVALLLLAYLIIKKRLSLLKRKYFLVLGILSILWWTYLVAEQLRYTPVCDATDDFCLSGQTFWGDFGFGSVLAVATIFAIGVPSVFIALLLSRHKHKKLSSKK